MDDNGGTRHSNFVIVPRTPGPLIELPSSRPRDEIDEALDAMFGDAPAEAPGPFDIVLVAGGAALAVTALLAGLPGWVLAAGVAGAVLGLVLPAHHAWTRLVRARSLRRARAVMAQGTPLHVGHPSARRLADAYRRVERASGAELGSEALEPAHLALLEVAGLLGGRRPQSPAELRYVTERADAVAGLATRLARPPAEEAPVDGSPPVDEDALRDSAVEAIRALEERTGSSSVARLEQMTRLLGGGERPDGNA